jgi:hypothetical protein
VSKWIMMIHRPLTASHAHPSIPPLFGSPRSRKSFRPRTIGAAKYFSKSCERNAAATGYA